jgi:hypothetical protein
MPINSTIQTMVDCGTAYRVGDRVNWWRQSGTSQAHWDEGGFRIIGFRGGAGNYMTVTAEGEPLLGSFEIGSPHYRLYKGN